MPDRADELRDLLAHQYMALAVDQLRGAGSADHHDGRTEGIVRARSPSSGLNLRDPKWPALHKGQRLDTEGPPKEVRMRTDGIAVLVPYFNPVGYRSHPRKLARSLEAFRRAGIAEHVYLTGAGEVPPLDANIAYWSEACPYLWHKERLINLAARRLPCQYTHIVWADNDMVITPDWPQAVADAFTRAPLVQAFREACYRTFEGLHTYSLPSALRPGKLGAHGVAWGAAREFFTEGPGLFDYALVGGGDSVFAYSLVDHTPMPFVHRQAFIPKVWSPALLAETDAWLAQARAWTDGRQPVAAETDVEVIQHGSLWQRRYRDRHALLGALDPARHLVEAPDTIHRWSDCGLAELGPTIRAYFHSRNEDEVWPAVVAAG